MAALIGFGSIGTTGVMVHRNSSHPGVRPIATLPFNMQAVEVGMRFGEGLIPYALIVGPSGWGKTHVLRCVEDSLERSSKQVVRAKAVDFLRSSLRPEGPELLLLDDLSDAMRTPKLRHSLRLMLERRLRAKRPTLVVFTGSKVTPEMLQILPSSRQWETAQVCEPSEGEKSSIVAYLAERIGLSLSPSLARMMARHLDGNGRTYLGALERLKLCDQDWTRPSDLCRAVGVLAPHLSSHTWDPRDEVFEAVTQVVGEDSSQLTDLCSYVMLREMQFSEGYVASFLKASPSRIYRNARRVSESMSDPRTAALVQSCRFAVVTRLSSC
ncbi:MAG: hypothetical protein MUC92_00540 [Fimbriimonadaceae bacterium]|jgi:hypothetical protein|nr:hypothetical protein [Fimbriimonadaceae bacterium]